VVFYGPCQVNTRLAEGKVRLQVATDYPFEEDVLITVTPENAQVFPLLLRIPGWCGAAEIAVNGESWPAPAASGEYLAIQRTWQPGDQVRMHFAYPIRLEKWERSEFGIHAAGTAVLRGPLTYALPVKEDWQPIKPPAQGPGKDVIAFRVVLADGAPWNYALRLNATHPERSLNPVKLPVQAGARPWEQPALGLTARARRVLNWKIEGDADHPRTPLLPYNPVQLSGDVEEVTLVPFGFTHLRLTYLPTEDHPGEL
jgi:hypothetical protein